MDIKIIKIEYIYYLKTQYEQNELAKLEKIAIALWKTIKYITNTQNLRSSPIELRNISDNPKSSVNEVCQCYTNVDKNLAQDTIIFHNNQSTLQLLPAFSNSPPGSRRSVKLKITSFNLRLFNIKKIHSRKSHEVFNTF